MDEEIPIVSCLRSNAFFNLLNMLAFPIGLVVQAFEKVEYLLLGKVFAVYNLILDFLVVKKYGISGIALVTGSAVLLKNITIFLLIKKDAKIDIYLKGILKITVNSLLAASFLVLFRPLITNIGTLILSAFLYTLVYGFFSFINISGK